MSPAASAMLVRAPAELNVKVSIEPSRREKVQVPPPIVVERRLDPGRGAAEVRR